MLRIVLDLKSYLANSFLLYLLYITINTMDYNTKDDKYYSNSRPEMLEFLPDDAKTALDVGCADGTFAFQLRGKGVEEIWGIEYMDSEAQKAKECLDNVFSGPCEDYIDQLPNNFFDVIYFNDVIEHLVDPYTVLQKIREKLTNRGVVISSIPNIRHHSIFTNLLFKKDWKYEAHGIMDKTHLRFFTNKSIRRMYQEAGYTIQRQEGINASSSLKVLLYNIPFLFTSMDMKYVQFATVAGKK